jgi:pyochelin synthetase
MDQVTGLLESLAQLGVKIAVDGEQLKISAAKGVLTGELRGRLLESKDEIIRRLQGIGEAARPAPARIVADPLADNVPFPLSDLQLGFYIANDPYMELHVRPHYYFEFDYSDLDVAVYEAAWNKALARHRRELCIVNDKIELQILEEAPEIRCQVNDWRGLPAGEAADRLLGVRRQMARQELRLDAWPWIDLRVSLWTEAGEERRQRARVHYNHNNYFVDGFGANLLLAEIDSLYHHPGASEPPVELSYRDAVLALERLAASEAGEASQRYWFSRLPGLPPPPAIPMRAGIDRRCRSWLTRRIGTLDRALWNAFKSHASAFGLTPSNAVIAAYATVVATWSNSDHFILSQMATRRFAELHPDLIRMLGNFASLYPLEIRLDPAASFAASARRLQEQVLQDVRHLQFGGMRVMQELNRLKGSFGSAPSPFVVGSGLFIKRYRKPDFSVLETSQTVLDHQFFELDDGSYFYVWDLMEEFFPAGLIDAMWEAFQTLLRRLAREPAAWELRSFGLVGERDLAERRERNRTGRPVPALRLHDTLRTQAAEHGERPVLATSGGTLRYSELEGWSAALASGLAARGIGRGDLVPVVMDRGEELLAAVLAVLKMGAAYVPLDPRLPRERLALMLADIGASVVLTQRRYAGSIGWPERVAPIAVVKDGAAAQVRSETVADPTDLAYVIYTSGSTGRPKGVMIDHRGAMNTVLDINERFAVGPSDRLFGGSAFNFDLSVYDIFGTIAAGACLVYPEPEATLDPTHWLDLVLREEITIWSSVPALMNLLVEAAERREVRLPSLRLVMLSGDKIPLDLPAAIRRVAPRAEVFSLGGATEASIWSIFYPVGEVDPAWATIPYGYPMVNQTWEVRDRHGNPCPTWVPGELCIGGVGLARGYLNDSEKTSRSFRPGVTDSERLYHTGDLGRYLPGGCIEWMGRIDFQVKVQGHRIELGEIEAVLAGHPAVKQAVAAVCEAEGARPRRLVAWIVPAEGVGVDARELESFLQGRLPAYMVPTAWMTLDQLPLTPNGKVDRKALLRLRGAEEEAGTGAARERVPPDNAVESRLLAIWERILGRTGFGVTEDFFDLGGQSFDAIRIFALIKEGFGRSFTLSDMWRARTIRELARGVAGDEERPEERHVVPISLHGDGDPLVLVHPAGGSVMAYTYLARRIGRPLYGIQASTCAEEASRRDVGALARTYVEELREVRGHGPYTLGGWSSGAMIAFEMAAQLEGAGETVRQVFILDGPAPVEHADLSDERLLLWFLDDLALGLPLDRLSQERVAGLSLEEQLRRAAALLEVDRAQLELELLVPTFRVFRDLIVAGSRYRPAPISADLTVVRVEDDIVDEFSTHPHRDRSDWGWGGLTRGQVRCVRVLGTHHSFLREPLVESWCSLLSEVDPAAAVGRT